MSTKTQKIDKLKAELHLLNPQEKLNTNTIFVDNSENLENFKPEVHFRTTKELADNNILDVMPEALTKPMTVET